MAVDTEFGNNTLVLQGNGTDGATNFVDTSYVGSAVTVVAGPTFSTTRAKFGGSSMKFVGAGYLSVPAPSTAIGLGDFTIDFWAYVPTGVGESALISQAAVWTSDINFIIKFDPTGNAVKAFLGNGIALQISFGNNTPFDTWTHFALVRSAGLISTYRGGVLATNSSTSVNVLSTAPIRIGAGTASGGGNSNGAFTGYLDQLRVTPGVARWTAPFTPSAEETTAPIPTSITAELAAPKTVVSGCFGGSVSVTAGATTITATSGATVNPISPQGSIGIVGRYNYGERAAFLQLPSLTLRVDGGASAALAAPLPALSSVGTGTNLGAAPLVAPTPILSATGKVSAVAGAALTAPMAKMVGYFGAVATVSITGKATLTASGTIGAVGRSTLTAPLFELTAAATRQNSGSAILTAPVGRLATTGAAWLIAPGAQLTAIGTAVVAVTYEAYALNLKHNPTPGVEPVDELTRYTNYPFDRIVRYKNSYFGMNNTGLYLLEGTTDFATPTPTEVPWSYKTALMDMKSVQLKNVSMAYFGGRMGPAATVSVYVGEASTSSYAYTTPRDATVQNYRQPLGKGLKSRYYAFGASGTGELTLDTLSLDVAVLARKV